MIGWTAVANEVRLPCSLLSVLLVDAIEELEIEFATRRLNCNRIDVWQSLANNGVGDVDFVVTVAENEMVPIVLANEFVPFRVQLLCDYHRKSLSSASAFAAFHSRHFVPPEESSEVTCGQQIHPPFRVRDQMGMSVQK